jgi:lipoate-protein ligase B
MMAEFPERTGSENTLEVHDLGFVHDYQSIWEFQKRLVDQRVDCLIPDSLIVVEHDHVLTLGRGTHSENVLVRDLPIFEIERGGDVTYHGPGQLVLYPVISLQRRNLGVRQFVELLERCVVKALLTFGLENVSGKLGSETGVWIGNKRKIASIGVAVSHWVTYHGLALNVNTDLSYFRKIKPCGFESTIMTSLARELSVDKVDMVDVKNRVLRSFSNELNLDLRYATTH